MTSDLGPMITLIGNVILKKVGKRTYIGKFGMPSHQMHASFRLRVRVHIRLNNKDVYYLRSVQKIHQTNVDFLHLI